MMTESRSVVSREQGGGGGHTAKRHEEMLLSDVSILRASVTRVHAFVKPH